MAFIGENNKTYSIITGIVGLGITFIALNIAAYINNTNFEPSFNNSKIAKVHINEIKKQNNPGEYLYKNLLFWNHSQKHDKLIKYTDLFGIENRSDIVLEGMLNINPGLSYEDNKFYLDSLESDSLIIPYTWEKPNLEGLRVMPNTTYKTLNEKINPKQDTGFISSITEFLN